ncbi:calmodulin-like protein 3 [Primulina huaijiensis]|uniref:calmodulin-like protein 3 n=1 Tax=Primulina huaijiensis TaxID=1492673 RepID=UPI003CC71BB1
MPAIFLWIFLVYKLLNTVFLYLIPKKLRAYFPFSWHLLSQQQYSKKSPVSPLPDVSRRMDASELKRVFQMFDRNGDGRITKEELNESLENIGILIPDKELSQMIEKIDVNLDGCVDIDEFGNLYGNIVDERHEEEDMREAFDVFDRDRDGFISVDELKYVLGSLGLKPGGGAEDCKKMIMKVDVDGDGLVDFKEFQMMMKGGGGFL